MANKLNIEKIYSEIDKEDNTEQLYEVYEKIKEFITKKLSAQQKELDEKSSELQSKISKITGNQ